MLTIDRAVKEAKFYLSAESMNPLIISCLSKSTSIATTKTTFYSKGRLLPEIDSWSSRAFR